MAPKNFINSIRAVFSKEEADIPISIFKVPNSITSSKPEAYVPQALGLGPVHHLMSGHMQMYKAAEAKRVHRDCFGAAVDFDDLAYHLESLAVASSRAAYDVYLDVEDGVLASFMAVDALFLFGLLCSVATDRKAALSGPSFLRRFAESPGHRLSQETALSEALMVENQIPIFVLKIVLMIECWKIEERREIVKSLFPRILSGFCLAVSPWNIRAVDYPPYMALKHSHVLDLLYHLITLLDSPEPSREEEEKELQALDKMTEKVRTIFQSSEAQSSQDRLEILPQAMFRIGEDKILEAPQYKESIEQVLDITKGLAPQYKKPIEFVQRLLGLPWKELKEAVSQSASAMNEQQTQKEALVPRASELIRAGIELAVANHISAVEFKPETVSFRLPRVTIFPYSEVLIRNLVAYESMIKSEAEPMILNRYVELMNGLVRSVEDVQVLKSCGIVIVKSESVSDEDVAKMFGGMRKSVQLTNTGDMDKAIEDVKSNYSGLRSVRARRFVEKWQRVVRSFSKVLVVLLLLVLMAIQSFCSVYECRRGFSLKTNNS